MQGNLPIKSQDARARIAKRTAVRRHGMSYNVIPRPVPVFQADNEATAVKMGHSFDTNGHPIYR